MLRRVAMHVRAIGVSDDQSGLLRENFARQILGEGEKQPVAMRAVILPFLVGAQILERGFDLDDPDIAALVQRHQIGAPSRGQRQFAHRGKAERAQQPRGAARDRQRLLGLPAVGRGRDIQLAGGRFHGAKHRTRPAKCKRFVFRSAANAGTRQAPSGLMKRRSREAVRRGLPQMIDDLWYKNGIFYCLSVGTYMDSDGDGIGDFKGLMRRLDYLQGLGITAVWLMPFQPSPGRDGGYDVSDYYNVDPRYGTLGDFVEFTHGCEQRGIRVLIDLVVNHTSDEHPWFREACRSTDSKYRDWYVWSKKKPKNAAEGVVFPGVQKSTWNYNAEAKAYYFHRFYEFQPDLNTSNPEVQAEILKIMGFWIQLGVSGFRMDAVPFIISEKGPTII